MTAATGAGRRGRPRTIEPDEVVGAATRLIDAAGLEQFSMRALAAEMGVRPMAFYTHFDDKDALLDAVADRFLRDLRLPADDGDWARYVVAFGEALRTAWTMHPHLLAVLVTRPGRGAAHDGLVAAFVSTLVSGGLSPDLAHTAWHAVQSLALGDAAQEAVWGPGASTSRREPERRVATTTDDHGVRDALRSCDPAVEFHTGLDLIVAGLRLRRQAADGR